MTICFTARCRSGEDPHHGGQSRRSRHQLQGHERAVQVHSYRMAILESGHMMHLVSTFTYDLQVSSEFSSKVRWRSSSP